MPSQLFERFRSLLGNRPTLKAHFWQSAANYVQQGFGMVFGIVLARLLAPSDFGNFTFANATVGLFLLPAAWSLAPLVVASGGRDAQVISDSIRFAWRISFAQLALSVVGAIYLWKTSSLEVGALGLAAGLAQAMGNVVGIQRASLEGQGIFKANFFDSLIISGMSFAFAVPAALAGWGAWALFSGTIPSLIVQYILFSKFSGLSLLPSCPPSRRQQHLQNGFVLWLSSLGEQMLYRVDRSILGTHCSAADLGNYNRAFNYAPIGARVLNSLITNPTVSALARAEEKSVKAIILLRTGVVLLVAGILNYILFACFSDPVVPWVFGTQWREAIPLFEAFAPLTLATVAAHLPTTLLLAQKRYTCLAVVRCGTLAGFLFWALTAGNIEPVSMAYAVQLVMLAQGLGFFCYLGWLWLVSISKGVKVQNQ